MPVHNDSRVVDMIDDLDLIGIKRSNPAQRNRQRHKAVYLAMGITLALGSLFIFKRKSILRS